MGKERIRVSREEWFDDLAERIRDKSKDRILGSYSRTLGMGQVAVGFSAFIPRENQHPSYTPSIIFCEMFEERSGGTVYWKKVSDIEVVRNSLDSEGTSRKLAQIEERLDIFDKLFDFRPERGD